MLQGILEITPFCLYDSCDLRDAEKYGIFRFCLFCRPIKSDPKKDLVVKENGWFTTWLRTNMYDANRLPNPLEFIVKMLNILFLHNGRILQLDETNLYGKSAVELRINNKTYWQSPAWACISPLVVFQNPKKQIEALKTDYGVDWSKIGANFEQETKWAGIPVDGIYLNYQEFFLVNVDIEGPVEKGTQVAVHLDGPLGRLIQ